MGRIALEDGWCELAQSCFIRAANTCVLREEAETSYFHAACMYRSGCSEIGKHRYDDAM